MSGEVVCCLFFLAVFAIKPALQSLQDDITERMNDTERSLSRKRRYLVFPEGSSLQLVFCLTMPSIGVGQIFTIGSTAALAWELPHDPFVPFRRPSELLHRIDKPKKHTSGGWSLQNTKSPTSVTYMKTDYNPFLINKPPAPGYSTIKESKRKHSTYSQTKNSHTKTRNNYPTNWNRKTYTNRGQQPTNRKTYGQSVTTYLNPVYHQVYRRTRRDLYGKLEKFFTALTKDGKACLLKAICEVSKATRDKGSFLAEIIKAIFKVRHHEDDGHEERDEYDLAANKQHNCTEIYPNCEHSIWGGMFSFS